MGKFRLRMKIDASPSSSRRSDPSPSLSVWVPFGLKLMENIPEIPHSLILISRELLNHQLPIINMFKDTKSLPFSLNTKISLSWS
jgi:hypothetical protein